MSTPKKTGKDLSALKARLAQKGAKAPAPVSRTRLAPSPPAAASRAAHVAQPEAAAPQRPAAAAQPQASAPVPAQPQARAPASQPAPAAPRPAAAPQPRAAAASDGAPFGGGAAFDPGDGLIGDGDGGVDVRPRKSTGLMLVVAIAGVGLGSLFGWVGRNVSDTGSRIESAERKGAEMFQEVGRVKDKRARISLGLHAAKEAVLQDPKKGAMAYAELVNTNLKDFPRADALFGWQLASMHPKSITSVFKLYEEANGLALDLPYLAQYVNINGLALRQGMAGPRRFALKRDKKENKGKLVEHVAEICDLEAKTPCKPGQGSKAVGHSIREIVGGPEVVLSNDEVTPISSRGAIFKYAIGDKPETNAANQYQLLVKKVEARLEALNKLEKRALTSLERFADSPTVNAETAQADPGE